MRQHIVSRTKTTGRVEARMPGSARPARPESECLPLVGETKRNFQLEFSNLLV